MKPASSLPAPALAPWSQVLDSLEAAVSRAVADAAERAGDLEAAAAVSAAPNGASWEEALAKVRNRCLGVETCAAGAAGKMAEIEAALADAERNLQAWLRETGAAREKLAGWVGRAVG